MTAGLEDFGRWLCDLVRAGTAAARQQPYSWWDATAARLVDAQLPGLAEQVRDMGSEIHRRDDWAEHLLSVSGRWWTATRAWSSRDALDRDAMADLRAFLGWAQPSADIKAADSVTGSYLVLGGHRTDDGRLLQQRTWLRDESTGETLVVLDFSAGLTPLATPQLAGTVVSTTVSRYPGTPPRRALFAADPVVTGYHRGVAGRGHHRRGPVREGRSPRRHALQRPRPCGARRGRRDGHGAPVGRRCRRRPSRPGRRRRRRCGRSWR